jgi:hypothetical protein
MRVPGEWAPFDAHLVDGHWQVVTAVPEAGRRAFVLAKHHEMPAPLVFETFVTSVDGDIVGRNRTVREIGARTQALNGFDEFLMPERIVKHAAKSRMTRHIRWRE